MYWQLFIFSTVFFFAFGMNKFSYLKNLLKKLQYLRKDFGDYPRRALENFEKSLDRLRPGMKL